MDGAEVVELVAQRNSVNPRLLLAIIEYRSGWLTDPQRPSGEGFDFPIRSGDRMIEGLHMQLTWAAGELSPAYYGLRARTHGQREFGNMLPEINAGTVALNGLLEEMCSGPYCTPSFMATYHQLFGDPWEYEIDLLGEALVQPPLILPFPGANEWVFTGGPHGAWGSKTPWAALDFAPKWDTVRRTSDKEVVAVADGIIARVGHGVLVLDLDGDGYEQTGWSIFYLHVIRTEAITEGTYVRKGQIIGQASSSGGVADGEHLHIARKYNGEWILADGPTPFELGSWRVLAGAEAYQGKLYYDDRGCGEAYFTVPIGGILRAAPMQTCSSSTLA
jgi:murein DD-endopeptidase MepM/ murein hydrolase activator NlpD